MSKARLSVSLDTLLGLLILTGGVGVWALPLRAPAQASSSNSGQAEKEIPPLVITSIQPVERAPIVYPPEAQATGIEGRVKLRVTINKGGSVEGIHILSGHPELVKASLESVSKWRYTPSNVDRVTIVTIVFARPRSSPFVHPLLVWPEPMPSDIGPLYVRPLEPIRAVRPVYPALAKMADVQGKVALRITVGKDGSVSDVKLLSGHPLLVKAALDAVTKWRYAPMDEPAVTDVTLDFTLPKGDRTGNAVTPPMLIYRPNPPYPQDAKAAKLEGNVVLQVTIEADGTVSSVEVVKSLDKRLDASAVQTVKTWKFLPAMKAGKPVPFKSTISINFKLS